MSPVVAAHHSVTVPTGGDVLRLPRVSESDEGSQRNRGIRATIPSMVSLQWNLSFVYKTFHCDKEVIELVT